MKPVATRKELHLGMHLIIASSAIAVLMLLGIVDRVTFSTLLSNAANPLPVTIGIEHNGSAVLAVVIARKTNAGYASIINDSGEGVHVSVPSEWKRIEVTGTALTNVTEDVVLLGFTRYALPAGAGIKMLLPLAPSGLFFESPSASTAAINLQTIDLTDESVTQRTVLVKDKTLVRLWESDE